MLECVFFMHDGILLFKGMNLFEGIYLEEVICIKEPCIVFDLGSSDLQGDDVIICVNFFSIL